jgi:hypothetical protein
MEERALDSNADEEAEKSDQQDGEAPRKKTRIVDDDE